jgi:hypothetical protein
VSDAQAPLADHVGYVAIDDDFVFESGGDTALNRILLRNHLVEKRKSCLRSCEMA